MSRFNVDNYKKLTIKDLEIDKYYQIRKIFRHKTSRNVLVFCEKDKERIYHYIFLPSNFDDAEVFKSTKQILKKYPENFFFTRKLFNGTLIFEFEIIKNNGDIIERMSDFYKLSIYHRAFYFKIGLLSNIVA